MEPAVFGQGFKAGQLDAFLARYVRQHGALPHGLQVVPSDARVLTGHPPSFVVDFDEFSPS